MTFDAIVNNAVGSVLTPPSPATTGTSLVLQAGQGAFFPATPFNATVWPILNPAANANFEIVRVTAVATDTLTITRAQEGTAARTILTTDRIAATVTKRFIDQITAILQAFTPAGGSYSGFGAITSGASSGTITFAALPFTPTMVLLTVETPSGGSILSAAYDGTTLSNTGFNYVLSAAAPASGYKLHYLVM